MLILSKSKVPLIDPIFITFLKGFLLIFV
jgi:hypothetical protein